MAELFGAFSGRLAARETLPEQDAPHSAVAVSPAAILPLSLGPIRLSSAGEPLTPVESRPLAVISAFQTIHQLAGDETLGAIATRYGVPLEALVWANDLDRGDALVVGQLLRIPRVSGLPYIVGEGETAAGIAQQFGVPLEAIVSFGPNRLEADQRLLPGSELFIPGATRQLPEEWLRALGGLEGVAARRAELAAMVRAEQTNIRTGPSTDHPQLARLDAGRRVALRARNGDWLEVELGAVRGWIRADMLDGQASQIAALPISNNFPPPPPRWVWPARGTLTSGFGPRWRSFHNGIDIANRAWTTIVAARSGRVREAGWCSGYGYCVKIAHDGGVETIYGHLIDQPVVSRGDEVSAGELIGYMGSTYDRAGGGYSTGVHLHFTVLVNGKAVNPLRFLP
jgi:murein DD-endopeptidase MepM/ murein hydrolase activator NlpD